MTLIMIILISEFSCGVTQSSPIHHINSNIPSVFCTELCLFSPTDHKPVELVYKVPSEIEGLSEISYSTSAEDCQRLWKQ